MSSLKNIKSIKQRPKDLIFGYIRKSTQSITYTTIPTMINYLCLLYYYLLKDKFVKPDHMMEISSSDKNDDTKKDIVNAHICNEWLSVNGDIIINPMKNPNVIATWTVKVNARNCQIGIHSSYENKLHSFGNANHPNYGWWASHADFGAMIQTKMNISYNKDWFVCNDVIKMQLNVPEKKLVFFKNNRKTNIVFENIDLSSSYHLKVRIIPRIISASTHFINNDLTQMVLRREDAAPIQLIDFDIKNCSSFSFHSDS